MKDFINSEELQQHLRWIKRRSRRPWNTWTPILGLVLFTLINLESTDAAIGICPHGDFRCTSSGKCVPKEEVCDQVRDCDDGSDESELICSSKYRRSLCGVNPKKVGVFQCHFGGCIPLSRVCDGAVNCMDGSDESEYVCGANSCLPGQFRCKYGACIPDHRMCNGRADCADGSDEADEVCLRHDCPRDQFRCRYGGCIAKTKMCDGWKDCMDGSDEAVEICLITRAVNRTTEDGVPRRDYAGLSPWGGRQSNHRRPTAGPLSVRKTTTTTTEAPVKIDLSAIDLDSVSSFESSLPSSCILPDIPLNVEATLTSCISNPNAFVCRPNITSALVPIGFTIDYSCSQGFHLNGPTNITCRDAGLWSSGPPTCEMIVDDRFGFQGLIPDSDKVTCLPIQPGRGVKVECLLKHADGEVEIVPCSNRPVVGTEAKFSCMEYYRPTSELPVHYENCSQQGDWSPGNQAQFSCVPDCGLSEGPKTPYITNGVASRRGQWPWHVAIYVRSTAGDLKYICGGALITEFAVLTSAHCVVHGGHVRNASTLVVYLGKQTIDVPETDPVVQQRGVAKVIVEESFNNIALDSDIAVLALDTAAILTYYVRPVCYPQTSNSYLEEYHLIPGSKGTVIGWGLNENGTLSQSLRQVELPVVSTATCAESHPEFFGAMTRSTTYCAGYKNGTGVCNGDSGGGMYFKVTQRAQPRWHIQGLVSYGVPQPGSKKCASNHFAVFTRVGRFGDWLVRTLFKENLS